MLGKIKNYLNPHKTEEGDFLRKARALSIILRVSIAAAVIILIVSLLEKQTHTYFPVVAYLLVAFFSLWLVRRGFLFFPGLLLPSITLVGVTIELVTGNGIHDLGVLFYPIVVIFAALLLGQKAAVVFAVLSLLSAAWVVHLEINGKIKTAFSELTNYADLVTIGVVLSIAVIVFWVILESLSQSILSARKAEVEIRELNTRLETRVLERTSLLQDANRELEAFSYMVSHDLMAPVRAIKGYTGLIQQDEGQTMSAESRRFLETISQNAHQMEDMIEGLLTFSRLSRHPINRQNIEMHGLVRQVLKGLSGEQTGRNVIIDLDKLPDSKGDIQLLRQVWWNLLSNALKFTRSRDNARIEISYRLEHGQPVYFIRDNGIGFEPKYSDRIYGVFQRLIQAREYEGAGVGLAIVQRIINRHGGKTWAEGEPGVGATFYFTLGSNDH